MDDQRTNEWYQARCGKLTASRIGEALARTKSGWGASRANMIATLVTERLTGTPDSGFVNGAMQWGIDQEPFARAAYEMLTGELVTEVGFVDHPTIAMAGASPDGLVGDDGLIEIKCPNTAKHIATLRGASIDKAYSLQMQWQMACTGRAWCDFVSYDPRMPEHMQLHIQRVERGAIDVIESEAIAFLEEVDKAVSDLLAKYPMAA